MSPELSILMPVYDEAPRLERAIGDVVGTDLPVDFELIVVDDGSTDGSGELLRAGSWPENVRVLRHEANRGKGAAVRTALAQARGRLTAVFDADLEYEPDDLGVLLEPLLAGHARAAFGVRAFDGYTSHSFLYVLGNRAVTLAANVLFNVYLKDLMTCQKVIETELFRELPLREDGFSIEPEIAARLIQRGVRIFEVPIHYQARSSDEGKKLTAVDGLRVLRTILRCRLRPA
ncbi:MAG: glycosyltransferase family 2 protein [Actinomycetota bacterium]|nr:glycosyltransferase family 2 protein [Actinomycetota bacterium]